MQGEEYTDADGYRASGRDATYSSRMASSIPTDHRSRGQFKEVLDAEGPEDEEDQGYYEDDVEIYDGEKHPAHSA